MANMVWAIEKTLSGLDGKSHSGDTSARETRAFFEQRVAASSTSSTAPLFENGAKIRYDIMSTVPENWIPFIPVRAQGNQRAIQLQRGAISRNINGDPNPPVPVQPRTFLLRFGLDGTAYWPYLLAEEEVPRSGTIVNTRYRRTRWMDGSVLIWKAAGKETGRGEGSSGLGFDRLLPKG